MLRLCTDERIGMFAGQRTRFTSAAPSRLGLSSGPIGSLFESERHTMVGYTAMQVSHHEIAPNIMVVTITGPVMRGPESEQITTLVSDLLHQAKCTLIFDLAGVTKIDSTGIGRFISSYHQVAAAGGEIRMAGARSTVFQAFHVCRLDTVFRFYPNVNEACQAGSLPCRTQTAS